MKRHPNPTRIIAVGLLCAFIGCSKENPVSSPTGNKEEVISTATILKTAKGSPTIGLQTRIGHKKNVCDGSCKKYTSTHMDCAGTGSECNLVGNIELEPPLGNGIAETPTFHARCLYPEDFSDYESLAMPARSFYMEETKQWLNIPQQILERDPQTYCFLIKNITFTGKAAYSNL